MKISNIILHCSASDYGSVPIIRQWHLQRKWRDIGYHALILNGIIVPGGDYIASLDGQIQIGRPWDTDDQLSPAEYGAHTLGMNRNSFGICLIGNEVFSEAQKAARDRFVAELCYLWGLKAKDVLGHYETPKSGGKTCPNFDMDEFRYHLQKIYTGL